MENVMRSLIAILLVGVWCAAGHASSRGTRFGISVIVVRRVVTPTPAGIVTTTCYATPCIQPRVAVEPADAAFGMRVVEITY